MYAYFPTFLSAISRPYLNGSAFKLVGEYTRDEPKTLDKACNVPIESKASCGVEPKEPTQLLHKKPE